MKTKMKTKTVLSSLILLCLILGGLNFEVSARTSPKITKIDYPVLVTAGETIRIVVNIECGTIFQKAGVSPEGAVTGIYLYYNLNSRIKYDAFLLYETGSIGFNQWDWQPTELRFQISTVNFITGDYVKFKVYFDWAGVGGNYKGTVESIEHRVDYRETDENYELFTFYYKYDKWFIISACVLVALVFVFFIRKRRIGIK